MKKSLSILVLFVLFFGAVPVAGAAPFSSGQTAPVAAPPMQTTPTTDATFDCVKLGNGTVGDADCTLPDMSPFDATSTMTWDMTSYGTGYSIYTAFKCPTENSDCYLDYGVYYYYEVTVSWSRNLAGSPGPQIQWDLESGTYQYKPDYIACGGTGGSGNCTYVISGFIPPDQIGSNIYLTVHGNPGSHSWAGSITGHGHLSLFPYATCENSFTALTPDTFTINPTIETPLGPTGSPADQQIYTTVIGSDYKVSISGKWNDGTSPERKDVAISWDGITWTAWADIEGLCESQGTDGSMSTIYLAAESTTFYIRANDTPGAFTNNAQGDPILSYGISEAFPLTNSCESQFNYDAGSDLVASVVVPGTSEGVLATSSLMAGEWYAVTVTSGTWQDEGSAPDRTDMEFMVDGEPNLNEDAAFHDLSGAMGDGVGCQSTDQKTWFIEAQNTTLHLRVNNTVGAFASNTGSLNVSVYHAAFDRNKQSCEFDFSTYGDPIHGSVDASQSNGAEFVNVEPDQDMTPLNGNIGNHPGLVPGAFYILETTGGPWSTNLGISPNQLGIGRYDMAVNAGSGWVPLADWDHPDCNVEIDALGHRRVYFQVPLSATSWNLRVNDDGTWDHNSGGMEWDLYQAISDSGSIGHHNPWQACTDGYQLETVTQNEWIPVTWEAGIYVNGGAFMCIPDGQTIPRPCTKTLSVGDTYAITITNGPWNDNVGNANRFDAAVSSNDGSTWYEMDREDIPNVVCNQPDQAHKYWTLMFTVQNDQSWRIRVDDFPGGFDDNTGNLGFKLSHVLATSSGDNTGTTGTHDPNTYPSDVRSGVCAMPAMLPVLALNLPTPPESILTFEWVPYIGDLAGSVVSAGVAYVGDWLDYVTFGIKVFFAWCPSTTDTLLAMINKFQDKEPIATVKELEGITASIIQQIQGYDWNSQVVDQSIFTASGRSQIESMIQKRFFPQDYKATNPWDDGNLVNPSNFQSGLPAYYYTCNTVFTGYLPSRLKSSVCFVNAWARETGFSFVMQMVIDLGGLMLAWAMLKSNIQELIYMMTGVRPWTKTGAITVLERAASGDSQLNPAIQQILDRQEEKAARDVNAEYLSKQFGGRYTRDRDGNYRRND